MTTLAPRSSTKNFTASTTVSIPGHENWHLAPIEMAWEGRSLREICMQLRDRKRNGGKSMKQMVDHMANDSLVGWAGNPESAARPPPERKNNSENWFRPGSMRERIAPASAVMYRERQIDASKPVAGTRSASTPCVQTDRAAQAAAPGARR